jgi:hypothetical protein
MSDIDYYSKYKKYKNKYLLLQYGGDLEESLTAIKNKYFDNKVQDVLKKLLEVNPKFNDLFNTISKLPPDADLHVILNEHKDVVKVFIEKLVNKLNLPMALNITVSAAIKSVFKVSSDKFIKICEPIIKQVKDIMIKYHVLKQH